MEKERRRRRTEYRFSQWAAPLNSNRNTKTQVPNTGTRGTREVPNVSRLESDWYTVTFYTNQEWGRCE
jgi:hypothetical protein